MKVQCRSKKGYRAANPISFTLLIAELLKASLSSATAYVMMPVLFIRF